MNELYYEQIASEIEDLDEIDDEEISVIEDETEKPAEVTEPENVPTTTKKPVVSRNIYIVPESDYPDKEGGNFILASHSGTSSISYFRNLYKLTLGDKVDITYNNKNYTYVITNIYTDLKDGDVAIKRDKSKTTLTLITCTKGDKTTQTIYICERI